jgi:integrase/recombinase XerD
MSFRELLKLGLVMDSRATRLILMRLCVCTIPNALGHANIQTTALYCDVTDDQLANAVNAI